MNQPARLCVNCGADLDIIARLNGRPRAHWSRKYCSETCTAAAERKKTRDRYHRKTA